MALTDISEPAVVAVPSADESSYVDWPAILGGTVLGSAISLVLLTFGSAVGLSFTSAYEGSGISLAAFAIAAGLWLIWVQISGFFAGGYLTGRMRRRKFDATEHESDIRDGSHGLIVWALGLLLGAFITISGASSLISGATGAATTVAGGAAAGIADKAGDALGENGILVDRLFRGGSPAAAGQSDVDQRAEAGRILATSVTADKINASDRQFLIDTVSARAGIPPQEAEKRVDDLWAQIQKTERQARVAADRARKIGVLIAFMTAASLLIGAVAAYFGAVLGGNHRDKQVVVDGWIPPRM